jgi:hypothetical protein
MNEIQAHKMAEDAAYGEWIVQAIADSIGVAPDPQKIDRAIYKGTDCGAWVRFDAQGVVVGTIVEGSEAEYSERIALSDDEATLCRRFWQAVQNCEDFASEHFDADDLFC